MPPGHMPRKLKIDTPVFVDFYGVGTVIRHGKDYPFGAFTEVLLKNGDMARVHPSNVKRLCKHHGDVNIDGSGKCLECES